MQDLTAIQAGFMPHFDQMVVASQDNDSDENRGNKGRS
jgi:hypothetical protein